MRYVALFLTSLVFSIAACAESPTAFVKGTDYIELESNFSHGKKDKITIEEFFWYGCPHCFHFEAMVSPWKNNQAEDVEFIYTPVVWRKDIVSLYAKAFYAAKALGVSDKSHTDIFKSFHVTKKPAAKAKQLQAFFASNYGIEAEKFDATLSSFGVNSQVKQAESRAKSYKISGTPQVVVNGKYKITGDKGLPHMIKVLDYLVAKERVAMKDAQ